MATTTLAPPVVRADSGGPGSSVTTKRVGDASFVLPADFEEFSKPVKTHQLEGNAKSTTVKGFTAGLTVDPIKLESLAKFGDPQFVGDRVVKVEQGRDGVTSVKLVAAGATTVDGVEYYELQYDSESSRGYNHVLSRLAIEGEKLYALEIKVKDESWRAMEGQARGILGSLRVGTGKF